MAQGGRGHEWTECKYLATRYILIPSLTLFNSFVSLELVLLRLQPMVKICDIHKATSPPMNASMPVSVWRATQAT